MPASVLAPLPVPKAAPSRGPSVEVTAFHPRPGREAPPCLQVVPNPFESERTVYAAPAERGATWEDILRMRGELPPPPTPKPTRTKAPKAAPVAPWNRKGFVYPEPTDTQGKHARAVASGREDMPRIRPTPKSLAALLKLPEWAGAQIQGAPLPEDMERLQREMTAARAGLSRARTQDAIKSQQESIQEIEDRIRRMSDPSAVRVVHPCGPVLIWCPT